MEYSINENIKRLRRQNNITQRDLAEYMHISHQTVSRWENGSRVPDVYTLPKIAAFFGVSIDELFYDRITNDIKYEALVEEKYNSLIFNHRYEEAKRLIFEAHEKLPNSNKITEWYINSLANENDPNDANLLETLSSRVISKCPDRARVYAVIITMVKYYTAIGELDKAMELANNQPNIWGAFETLSCIASDDDNLHVYIARTMYSIFKTLFLMCEHYERIYDNSRLLESYERYLNVLKACFNGHDYCEFNALACRTSARIATCHWRMGNVEAAYSSLDMAADYYKKYYSKSMQRFTDSWFYGLDFKTGKTNDIYPEIFNDYFSADDLKKFRNNERFRKIVRDAEKTAEKYKV